MTGYLGADAFLVANEHGVVVDVNEAGCGLFGRSKVELLGLRVAPHSQPEILAEVDGRWSEIQASGGIAGSASIERPDGDHTAVHYVAQLDLPVTGWTLVRLRATDAATTR